MLRVLDFRFQAIQLNRLSWRDFLEHENPVAAALMAKMKIAPEDRYRVKASCIRLLATLRLDPARTRLLSGFIDTYLRLDPGEEKLFREEVEGLGQGVKEKAMEIVTSWTVPHQLPHQPDLTLPRGDGNRDSREGPKPRNPDTPDRTRRSDPRSAPPRGCRSPEGSRSLRRAL